MRVAPRDRCRSEPAVRSPLPFARLWLFDLKGPRAFDDRHPTRCFETPFIDESAQQNHQQDQIFRTRSLTSVIRRARPARCGALIGAKSAAIAPEN
jgi:hypothetical protein